MLVYVAALLFGLAFLVSGGAMAIHSAWFAPPTLIAAGLACWALHAAIGGTVWPVRRR